jgi:hypothetical protein
MAALNQSSAVCVSSRQRTALNPARSSAERVSASLRRLLAEASRPWDWIDDVAVARHQVVGRQPPARRQDPSDPGIERGAVLDIHRHVLQERAIEGARLERELQRVADMEPHPIGEPAARRQIGRGVDETRAEVDSGHRAAEGGGEIARWAADAAA